MENIVLTNDDIKDSGLTQEDLEYIDREMMEEVEETKEDIDAKIDDALLDKIGAIIDIEDANERLEQWNKEFPNNQINF